MSILKRYPLTSFFILAYAITWAGIPFGWFFTFGPLLAALIVVGLTQGKAGLREWGSRLIRWRVGWVWYVLAITVPLAVLAVTFGISLSAGAGPPSLAQLAPGSVVLIFAVRLINPLDGPVAEEPGWRGFAQPGLQRRYSPLVATSILGLLVAGWHLPCGSCRNSELHPSSSSATSWRLSRSPSGMRGCSTTPGAACCSR